LGFAAGDDGEFDEALLVALNHERHHQCSLYRLPSFRSSKSKAQVEM
jgi:hypothetical protein